MPINQLSPVDIGYVDKRKALSASADHNSHTTEGNALFTANGAGSTTTIVGANAAPGANDTNIVRRGEKFRLFTSAGVLKEETVFTVTNISVGASTTVTFSPAAATATASTNIARSVDIVNMMDDTNLDARLTALGRSESDIRLMTQNDKVYALRVADDPAGV